MYLIRSIEKSDNVTVAALIRKVMTEFGAVGEGYSIEDPEVDQMFETYTKSDAAFYVVEKEGIILGVGGIGPLTGSKDKVCELRKMYFLNELRGKGMGAKLLAVCIEKAKSLGYEKMYLETLKSMAAANSLYQKYGFVPLDKNIGNTGHFGCDAYYALDLS